ncbi:hypothetical protein DPMN_112580 [Dreissena polymorpha]|uniref:Uncharacterized protein n=1 Tax=Dreissena polymorpha TaxID=45954 RepID=A0A9D4KHC4_DREPO|nr:hypothetical protein DPMN_112580 [Dreissena polymorpha]
MQVCSVLLDYLVQSGQAYQGQHSSISPDQPAHPQIMVRSYTVGYKVTQGFMVSLVDIVSPHARFHGLISRYSVSPTDCTIAQAALEL